MQDNAEPPKYFASHTPEAQEAIAAEEHGRPAVDPGGDALPFGHISDRQFEIIVYRLKQRQHPGKRVTLMTGVGERGRDVVTHLETGRLEEIDQCKLLAKRLSGPDAARELLKLGLYAQLDPKLLPDEKVTYELWAPGDFTEAALELLASWPKLWPEQPLEKYFQELREEYVTFRSLVWPDVQNWVTESFPYRLNVVKLNGVDISQRIRAHREIHDKYFTAVHVMPAEAVKEEIGKTLGAQGVRLVTELDERTILDRMKTFKAEERLCYGPFLFGIPADLVQSFSKSEHQAFVAAVHSAYNIVPVVALAAQRLAAEWSKTAAVWPHQHLAFTEAVSQFLAIKAMLQLEFHNLAGMEPFTERLEIVAYRGKTNRQIFEMLAGVMWKADQKQANLTEPLSPDEFILRTLAQSRLENFKEEVSYSTALLGDYFANEDQIQQLGQKFTKMIPKGVMVVSDTRQLYENDELMANVLESFKRSMQQK